MRSLASSRPWLLVALAATWFLPMASLAPAADQAAASSTGSLRGPLPEEQNEIIRFLAAHHQDLVRAVEITEAGYRATTTSENPEVAAKLKEHFAYMSRRMGAGAMVRRWDPAFREMVEHHRDIEAEVEILDDGIRVVVTGHTEDAVHVAQNHARIVSGFVSEGEVAVRRSHEPALAPSSPEKPGP